MMQSWEEPLRTFDLNGRAGAALAFELAGMRGVRLVHASSAEIFGRAPTPIQNESTSIDPVSPYGIAKAAAHMTVRLVRQANGCQASNLILYPAESPRRRSSFVIRKITRSVAEIVCGDAQQIVLGNADAVRDFTHARDVAAAAKLLALGATAGDYVCSSGVGHSIREVCETTCRLAGLDPTGRMATDPALLRPNDIPSLVGDNSALRALGWAPRTSFTSLLQELLDHDLAAYRAARLSGLAPGAGG
jgi:GDPmannose 4,6-dehydratase